MVKVADEVWIGTALLHREQPHREVFTVREIVDRVAAEGLTEFLRPGVQIHAQLHCVANKRPNPGIYRMLYAPAEGGRRLYRSSDDYHPYRRGGKVTPEPEAVPPDYHPLIDWYFSEWDPAGADPANDLTRVTAGRGIAQARLQREPAAPETLEPKAVGVTQQIALVSCVKGKQPHPAAAADLYVSPLFQKARNWAEAHCDSWYILSAKYGLVAPDQVIEPYEYTLKALPHSEKVAWAQRVQQQLRERGLLQPGTGYVWLAGAEYRQELSRLLGDAPQQDPLAGMKIGQRLQWLTQQLNGVKG